jgi:uncharacterized protein (DUF488 family)
MIFTVGHSNHSLTGLLDLLALHSITALADVRSQPVSSYTPHFSRAELEPQLGKMGVNYVFLGKQLGGRSSNPACYEQGRLQYAKVACEPSFEAGIARLKNGAQQFRLALMCSEKDPLGCHRALLVGRRLHQDGLLVQHIRADGLLESHSALELRLLALCGLTEGDMFRSRTECISDAYKLQGSRVAHADESMHNEQART